MCCLRPPAIQYQKMHLHFKYNENAAPVRTADRQIFRVDKLDIITQKNIWQPIKNIC